MHRLPTLLCVAACGAFAAGSAAAGPAEAGNNAVAAKIGALGLGLEYAYSLSDRLAVRVGFNGGGFGFDAVESGIAYNFDVNWDSLSAGVDFHPTKGAFRVSGGVLRNDNSLDAVSRAASSFVVGGTEYTPAEVGTLTARASFAKTAPFVGVGWDWSRRADLFGVSLDLGVLDQGSPRVALRADGGLAADPMFANDIATEQAQLTDALKSYDLIPYASLGFVFRF